MNRRQVFSALLSLVALPFGLVAGRRKKVPWEKFSMRYTVTLTPEQSRQWRAMFRRAKRHIIFEKPLRTKN